MSLPEGSILINRYKIENLIKKGGMGVVYLAEDLHLERKCAVKELMLNAGIKIKGETKRAIVSFKREAKILADLHHTNLPKVYDYFVVKNKYFLVMDYIEGNDLMSMMEERNFTPFSEEEIIDSLRQICDVLNYLHSQEPPIIYRDLKPSNIMTRKKDKKLILIDFGIALITGGSLPFKEESLGTLGYVPPEQCEGKASVRSDIYSLGATAYHLLTGSPPPLFVEHSVKEIRQDISDELDKIIARCLKTKPEERYPDAKTLNSELEKLLKNKKEADEIIKEKAVDYKTEILSSDRSENYDLQEKGLYNILYEYFKNGRSGKLELTDNHETGEIYFNRGNIVDAKLGILNGEDALNSFFTWNEGKATYLEEVSDVIKITKSSASLLRNCLKISREIEEIKKETPFLNLDTALSIKTPFPAEEKFSFSPLDIAIIAYVKNRLSIRQIARKVEKNYFKILRTIHKLYEKKLVFIPPSIPEEEIKILIADDESSLRNMIKSFLKDTYGFQIETASDGVDCCIKLNIFKPHIIILDICMPDMSGWEVCHAIKKLTKPSRPEVLIITAVKNVMLEELKELGFTDILYKPFGVGELTDKLDNLIKKIRIC